VLLEETPGVVLDDPFDLRAEHHRRHELQYVRLRRQVTGAAINPMLYRFLGNGTLRH
jgi:hypothetical protein